MLVRSWKGDHYSLEAGRWTVVRYDDPGARPGTELVLERPGEEPVVLFKGSWIDCRNVQDKIWDAWQAGRKTLDLEPIFDDIYDAPPEKRNVVPFRVLPPPILAQPKRPSAAKSKTPVKSKTTTKSKPRGTTKGRGSRKGK